LKKHEIERNSKKKQMEEENIKKGHHKDHNPNVDPENRDPAREIRRAK